VVPQVAEFMARQRGFARADILRLNAYPDSYLLLEDNELTRRFNRAFYGAQDFALVAWKSDAP
jgi:O-antigen chain-terminating methyltransferase